MTETEDRIRALPLWKGPIDIAPLTGGLSNESYIVTEPGGRHVVRIGRDFPFHHVFREREAMVSRAAHAAGFAPEVRHIEPGLMVTEYLAARTYTPADVRANAGRIARLLVRFHQDMASRVTGAGFLFWVFHVIRDYAGTLKTSRSRWADRLPGLVETSTELEAAQTLLPIVFGHNDLLPANFLDDGHRLWLIDFEYAGFNTAMFDLAGVASNAGMNAAQAQGFVETYLGRAASPEIIRAFSAMQAASLLREAMWGMVSELHLNAPGVDYVEYARENLDKFEAALARYRSTFPA